MQYQFPEMKACSIRSPQWDEGYSACSISTPQGDEGYNTVTQYQFPSGRWKLKHHHTVSVPFNEMKATILSCSISSHQCDEGYHFPTTWFNWF